MPLEGCKTAVDNFLTKTWFDPLGFSLPPAFSPQSDFQGKIFLRKNFHPFSGLDGGSSQHFYTHLNALKTARIESREDSKTLTVAEIGKNGVFFVKRARCNPRFSHFGCPSTLRGLEHPLHYEIFSRVLQKKHHFSRFRRR